MKTLAKETLRAYVSPMTKRRIRLIGNPLEEKAWAAVMWLSKGSAFVHIDSVGDFLIKCQVNAPRGDAASERYAARPGVTKLPNGWDLHHIATALSQCVDHKTIQHEVRPDGNYFRGVPAKDHDMWSYKDVSTPEISHV